MRNWTCTKCDYQENNIERDTCKKCAHGCPIHIVIKIGDWTCINSSCRFYNFAREYTCVKCKCDRPIDGHFDIADKLVIK